MHKVDRKIPPAYKQIEKLNTVESRHTSLANNIPVWLINTGSPGALRVEMVFDAGAWFQSRPLVATATNSLLPEGTHRHSSREISQKLEFYGAYLNQFTEKDSAGIMLYALEKHLEPLLNILSDIVSEPAFPENELSVFLSNKKEEFAVNIKKVKFLAHRKFSSLIFGDSHPYGQQADLADFDRLNRDELVEFHRCHYHAGNCKIIVAGGFDEKRTLRLLNRFFGDLQRVRGSKGAKSKPPLPPAEKQRVMIPTGSNVQSAIRVGRIMFNKLHPDFPDMMVLNEVLGGYFGSRLMKNLREDKGYTYSIGSAPVSHINGGYFTVATEVGSHVWEEAIKEIRKEFDLLCDEPVPEEELLLVKNYMMGDLLRSFDGPFAVADNLRSVITYGEGMEFFSRFTRSVADITPRRLQELAVSFFGTGKMCEVVAGSKAT